MIQETSKASISIGQMPAGPQGATSVPPGTHRGEDQVVIGGHNPDIGIYTATACAGAQDVRAQRCSAATLGLAQILQVPPESIQVTGYETYMSGPSLGVSERGGDCGPAVMVYAYRVSMRCNGEAYDYRAPENAGLSAPKYIKRADDGFGTFYVRDSRGLYVPDTNVDTAPHIW